jgi:hypothetical protein
LKRLLLQAQLRAVLAQFTGGEVEFEDAEARNPAGIVACESGHGR